MDSVNEVALDIGFLSLCLMTLWLYLPGFLANTFAMMWGKWLPKTGYGPWPIDGGRNWKDGNRILGDGKTWNGLIGGSMTSGLLCMLIVSLMGDAPDGTNIEAGVFAHPLTGFEDAWFNIGGEMFSAFIMGTFLGFACLLGDSTGSFVKRRRGLKREGEVSSKAPLLDTLPFAIMVFLWGQLFLGESLLSSTELVLPMLVLVVITPILHRSFNLIGYSIGWKDVPY
ncbi:MAG: CDP-archaeol synthase [Candidatus Poseidoniaceae archaeon]|nr:CDP-archaeol synthase [Candidatus Poseidoniaceae archaeon]